MARSGRRGLALAITAMVAAWAAASCGGSSGPGPSGGAGDAAVPPLGGADAGAGGAIDAGSSPQPPDAGAAQSPGAGAPPAQDAGSSPNATPDAGSTSSAPGAGASGGAGDGGAASGGGGDGGVADAGSAAGGGADAGTGGAADAGGGGRGGAGGGQTRWVESEATPAAETVASVTMDDAGNAWLATAGGGELRLSKIDRGGNVVLERRFAYARELSTRAVSPAPGSGVFLAVPGACFRGCVLPIPTLDLGGGPIGNDGAIVRFDATGAWVSQFSITSADVPSIASDGRGRVAVLQGAQVKTVVVYDASGSSLFQAGPFAAPRSLPAFAPDGTLLAAFPDPSFRGAFAARTAAYDASGQERWTCTALSGQVPRVVLAVGNDAFAWLDGNQLVLSAVPSCVERFRIQPDVPVTGLLPMPDGGVLAIGWQRGGACSSSGLRRYDPTGALLWSRDLPVRGCGDVRAVDGAVAPDRDVLAAGIVAGRADLGSGERDAGGGDAFVIDVAP